MYVTINLNASHGVAIKILTSALHLWTVCKNVKAIKIVRLGAAPLIIARQPIHVSQAEK